MRPTALKRHHDRRIIAKRAHIINNAWNAGPADWYERNGWGRLRKFNLSCNCSLCKAPRFDRKSQPEPDGYEHCEGCPYPNECPFPRCATMEAG